MNNLPRPPNRHDDQSKPLPPIKCLIVNLDEAIKRMIYGKSPKEAANEYLMNSKHHMTQPLPPGRMTKVINSPPKSKTHTLSVNMVNPVSNKENQRHDENSYGSSKLYVDEPEAQPSAFTELSNKLYTQKLYGSNQQRLTKVANPVDDRLLLSVNDAQKIDEARYMASRNQQDDVVNRLIKQGEVMNEHSKALTNAYLNKELQECTFAPRITNSKPRRNFNQFLEDQKQFQSQKEMKKKKLQEKTLYEKSREEPSYRPEICQNSVKMLKKKKTDEGSVHQRLYNIGKNAQTKYMQGMVGKDDTSTNRESIESSHFIGMINTKGDIVNSSSLYDRTLKEEANRFTPTIQKKSKNLKREGRIDNILYNDALRRQHKVVEASKMRSKSTMIPTMSVASRRALAMRFIKEFDIAVLEFLEVGKEPKLNYLQLNEFLRKLCFLKESEQVENPHFTPERMLLHDMWYILSADKKWRGPLGGTF